MKRVLLKLSGEALAGDKHMGFDEPTVTKVAKQVKEIVDKTIEKPLLGLFGTEKVNVLKLNIALEKAK